MELLQQQDRTLSTARGLVFLLSLLLFLGWATGFGAWLALVSLIVFAGFVLVLARHEQIQRILVHLQTNQEILQQQLARMDRDWDSLSSTLHHPAAATAGRRMPDGMLDDVVMSDLDVFGLGSVWMLVSQARTPWGHATLHRWLRCPADPMEISLRQRAVQWLAAAPNTCIDFYLHSQLLSGVRNNISEFVDWAEERLWSPQHRLLLWIMRVLAVGITSVGLGLVFGWLSPGWALLLFALFVVNTACNMLWIGAIHDQFNKISSGRYDLLHCVELLRAVDRLPDDVPRLTRLKSRMRTGDVSFETALVQLQRVLRLANGRKSGLLGIPWLVAQILWFWDFHVILLLERWKSQYGKQVRQWFEAVGELEAIGSLATLCHDHPDWCFPVVEQDENVISARAMGHALLPPKECVPNDVEVGPDGTFLLVTGSNMSGKSTLLRALGVNTLLALAGGPVCANEFRLPPVEIATSMRVSDSLQTGVSFFMAELQRVKSIVDRAKQLAAVHEPRLLYLLDEILQGTNSAERHIAVTRILRHLLQTRALGAISTHDLELAEAPAIQGHCQLVHLRETIEQTEAGERMRFDYVLHQGVTPTTNALRLLDMIGLKDFKRPD